MAFKHHHFRVHEAAKVCHLQDSGFTFHAVNFVERGILTTEGKMGGINIYAFATNPQKNPECFINENMVNSHQTSNPQSTAPIPLEAACA